MSARRWTAALLCAAMTLSSRHPALCQSARGAPVAVDLAATAPEAWRVLVEDATLAPERAGVTIEAFSITRFGTKRDFLGITLPFSSGTDGEAFTLLYAGPPLPELLLSQASIVLYGLNTKHSLAMLLRDGNGRLHELGMGDLDFSEARTITSTVVPAFGPVIFAGIRVYALPSRVPRERRLLLLVANLELKGGDR